MNAGSRIAKLRRGIIEEEKATNEIMLGEEFQDCQCLTVSEVHHYLKEKMLKTYNPSPYLKN